MNKDDAQHQPKPNGALSLLPLAIALVGTIAFLVYALSLAQETVTIDDVVATRYSHFLSGTPNTMGDTLSGFVGSLTLIWVVASVIQQSLELRAQRKEFAEMARAQASQVKALEEQTHLLRFERSKLEEHDARRLVDQRLKNLTYLIRVADIAAAVKYRWEDSDDGTGVVFLGRNESTIYPFYSSEVNEDAAKTFLIESGIHEAGWLIKVANDNLSGALTELASVKDPMRILNEPDLRVIHLIVRAVDALLETGSLLSQSDKEMLEVLPLPQFREKLEAFMALSIFEGRRT